MHTFLPTPAITSWVTPLRTRLSSAASRWRRCSSLRAGARSVVAPCQRTASPPARARPTAVSRLNRSVHSRLRTHLVGFSAEIAEAVAAQLHVQALTRQAEHFGRRRAVVAGQLERCLDAQLFDHIGGFADDVAQRHAAQARRPARPHRHGDTRHATCARKITEALSSTCRSVLVERPITSNPSVRKMGMVLCDGAGPPRPGQPRSVRKPVEVPR